MGGILFHKVPLAALWVDAGDEATTVVRQAGVTAASADGVAGVGFRGGLLGWRQQRQRGGVKDDFTTLNDWVQGGPMH